MKVRELEKRIIIVEEEFWGELFVFPDTYYLIRGVGDNCKVIAHGNKEDILKGCPTPGGHPCIRWAVEDAMKGD